MSTFKMALCSTLLATSALASAQTSLDNLDADKRIVTLTPVTSQGYMIYNLGLGVLLKKIDVSALPIPDDKLEAIEAFLNSYEVANVVLPSKPTYNGQVKFDVVSTESGKGKGSYVFEQTYKSNMVTLRVIATPLPGIPASPEITEAMNYLSEVVSSEAVN